MAEVVHIRCRYCGELLTNRLWPYCPPCNLYLCYRAMPILLGMLFPLEQSRSRPARVRADRPDVLPISAYEEEPCIMVSYLPKQAPQVEVAPYEEELCIMVPY